VRWSFTVDAGGSGVPERNQRGIVLRRAERSIAPDPHELDVVERAVVESVSRQEDDATSLHRIAVAAGQDGERDAQSLLHAVGDLGVGQRRDRRRRPAELAPSAGEVPHLVGQQPEHVEHRGDALRFPEHHEHDLPQLPAYFLQPIGDDELLQPVELEPRHLIGGQRPQSAADAHERRSVHEPRLARSAQPRKMCRRDEPQLVPPRAPLVAGRRPLRLDRAHDGSFRKRTDAFEPAAQQAGDDV
jgi:hypothetical protein